MRFHQYPAVYVDQVFLKVIDIERSIRFYCEVIGFRLLERSEREARLTADGKKVLLTIEQPEGVAPARGRTTGLYHFALLLPRREDLAALLKHLADHDIRLGASDHLVSEALYLSDPDGNGIEIYRDREPSEWTWHEGQIEMAVDPLDYDGLQQLDSKSWSGLPEATTMGHIHLHVSDLDEAERFYVQGLGLQVVSRYGSQALFVSSNNYHHHIGLNVWNGIGAPRPAPTSTGLKHYSLVYPDKDTLTAAIDRLGVLGAAIHASGGSWTTEDFSGNKLLLTFTPE